MRYLITILLLIGLSNGLIASHSMGADLTYECIGDNTYRFRLSFYRDCEGIDAPDLPYVTARSSCGDSTIVFMTPLPGTGLEVTPTCDAIETTCASIYSAYNGAQEYIYEGEFELPSNCDEWFFSYTTCCRNSAVNTIFDPANQDMYIGAYLNKANAECNSSPHFSIKPVPFICIGQEFCFNHGAIDQDGDSLVYELIDPMINENESVTYLGSYSNTNPINSNPSMSFDPASGSFCLTPTMYEVTVMGVKVKEYRNGELIGYVMRDMQLRTMECNNSNPMTTGINGEGIFSTSVCGGSEICFDIPTFDPDEGQQLTMSWNNGIENATMEFSDDVHPIGRFCWQTNESDVREDGYCFTISVQDDNCPYLATQVYAFCIEVIDMDVDLGNNLIIGCLEEVALNAVVSGGTGNEMFNWSNGSSENFIEVGIGDYWVDVSNEIGCIARDSLKISSVDGPIASFEIEDICFGDSLKAFNNSIAQGGNAITAWEWELEPFSDDVNTNFSLFIDQPGEYDLTLTLENEIGCTSVLTKSVSVNPIPEFNLELDQLCSSNAFGASANAIITQGEVVQVKWFVDGSAVATGNDATFNLSSGMHSLSLISTSTEQCVAQLDTNLIVLESPVFNYEFPSACQGDVLEIIPELEESDYNIVQWAVNGEIIPQTTLNYSIDTLGNYIVSFYGQGINGCIVQQIDTLEAVPEPQLEVLDYLVCLDTEQQLEAQVLQGEEEDYTFEWIIDEDTLSTFSPVYRFSNINTNSFTVEAVSASGCSAIEEVYVQVMLSPQVECVMESHCEGGLFEPNWEVVNGYLYNQVYWEFGDELVSMEENPAYTFERIGEHEIHLTVTGENGCIFNLDTIIEVYPNPMVSLSSNTACEFQTFTVSSEVEHSIPVNYLWNIDGDFQGTDEALTIADFPVGQYGIELLVLDENRCFGISDTVVYIHEVPSIQLGNYEGCQGDSILYSNPAVLEEDEIESIRWQFNNQEPVEMDSFMVNQNVAGPNTLIVTVESNYGCANSDTMSLMLYDMPSINLETESFCVGQSTTFTYDLNLTYGVIDSLFWALNNDEILTDTNFYYYTSDIAGTNSVYLEVTSSYGCKNSIKQDFDVWELPVVDFSTEQQTGCRPLCTSFSPEIIANDAGIASYNWNLGTETINGELVEICYDSSAFYTIGLHVVDLNGCESEVIKDKFVKVYGSPNALFELSKDSTSILDAHVYFQDKSTDGHTYLWDFGDGATSNFKNPDHLYQDTGEFIIKEEVTSINGCKTIVEDTIFIYTDHVFYAPNSFSPNGDGSNDVYHFTGYDIQQIKGQIFDRWGQIVKEFESFDNGWNGSYGANNSEAPIGTYIYKVEVITSEGKTKYYEGIINLIR